MCIYLHLLDGHTYKAAADRRGHSGLPHPFSSPAPPHLFINSSSSLLAQASRSRQKEEAAKISAELGRELVGWRTISRLVCSLSISARNKDKEEKSLLAACFPVPPSTPPQQHLITYATNEMAGTDGEREQVCRAWLKDDT